MRRPPTSVATTGVPQACASRATRPNDSLWLGTATTSAARVPVAQAVAGRRRGGSKRTTRRCRASARGPAGRWARASPLPLGPPTTATTRRSRRAGSCSQQPRGGVQQDVGRLERLDAPDEQQQDGIGRHAEAGAGAAVASPGRKCSRSTPGATVTTRPGSASYRSTSWRGLVGGVGDQPVGGVDDLLLADDAAQRLGGVAVGQREVLHLGERVRGVHERHAPALAGQPADLPGQPVVGVHDVVPAGLVRGLGAQDAARSARTAAPAGPPWTAPRTGRR